MMIIATTYALLLVRVPGKTGTLPLLLLRDTATLKLLLLTSFAAVTTVIAYADANVARVAVLTALIVLMLLLHTQKV